MKEQSNSTEQQCNKQSVMQCSVLITKLIQNIWTDVNCKKNAKYIVSYKLSKNSEFVKTKKCCTQHKNKLLNEIHKDGTAILISVLNIA